MINVTPQTFLLALLLLGLLGGCSGAAEPEQVVENVPPRLLVWRESGPHFNNPSATEAGEIGFIGSDPFTPVLEVPPPANIVRVCGSDGRDKIAFYVGAEQGDIYLMTGGAPPQQIGSAARLTCLDDSTFRYSLDQQRLAYIDYGSNVTTGEFIDGRLRMVNAADGSELFRQEDVAAFDLDDERLLWMRFFTNPAGQAGEAVFYLRDSAGEREVATLLPDRDCRYTSTSVMLVGDDALLLMGHRCRDRGTSWQLYRAEIADRRVSLLVSAAQPGGFVPYTRTNRLYLANDGQHLFFTVPDGVTANTVSLLRVNLSSLEVERVIERQVVMPTLLTSANAFPQRSADGRWLALVVTSPNGDHHLALVDLNTGETQTVSAGPRGNVIPNLRFQADGNQVYYLAGQAERGGETDLSLMRLDAAAGTNERLARGRYAPGMAVSPQGNSIALLEYIVPESGQQPYLNLVQRSDETVTLLDMGAVLADGRVTERHFSLPLSWRP